MELISRLQDQKADKNLIEAFQKQLIDCNKKLMQISVYTNEVVKEVLPKKEDTHVPPGEHLNGIMKRRDYLINQG